MSLSEYKDELINYLLDEKTFIERDILCNEQLSEEEKIDKGLLLKDCRVTNRDGDIYALSVSINNSKLRSGDIVSLTSNETRGHIPAKVIENNFKSIIITTTKNLKEEIDYDIHVKQVVMLDTLINLISQIDDGLPGATLLKILSNCTSPEKEGLGKLKDGDLAIPENFNDQQSKACKAAFLRPNIYCIQGPPGTGKTDVLATIARAYSVEGKTVLIISNTHQAVNNALAKVALSCSGSSIYKIGDPLKGQGANKMVKMPENFNAYLHERRSRKHTLGEAGDIIGMTHQSALVNMGIHSTGINPSILLVDEAGQMPLVEASALGSFGCGSIIFIGDDRQMPPIFHEKLQEHELSTSIFSYLAKLYPDFCLPLNITYRMNEEITRVVSKNFYEPYGIELIASDYSKDRKLRLDVQCEDKRIEMLLSSEKAMHQINVSKSDLWEDYNVEEAQFVAQLVSQAKNCGMNINDIAVITPYRRQVRTIGESCREILSQLPIIDTVERLQGQDVDLIIMSMSVTNKEYYKNNKNFLLNPNRLNVMLSRAKKKVIILASEQYPSLI